MSILPRTLWGSPGHVTALSLPESPREEEASPVDSIRSMSLGNEGLKRERKALVKRSMDHFLFWGLGRRA